VKKHQFQLQTPAIVGNLKLRKPQREAYAAIQKHFGEINPDREIGLVLPVGCGKSGLIAITSFALKATRVLVLAPGLGTAHQLLEDFDPTAAKLFYSIHRPLSACLSHGRSQFLAIHQETWIAKHNGAS
jgi:Type III restriction enzyme, res subunit